MESQDVVNVDYRLRSFTEADHAFYWDMRVDSYQEYVERLWGWDEDWQRARFEESMNDKTIDRQIIERDGEAIGLLELTRKADVLTIKNVQVMSVSQGVGIGTLVIRRVLADALAAGQDVSLQVFHINSRALALYGRLGFEETGRTETHVQMRWTCPVQGE